MSSVGFWATHCRVDYKRAEHRRRPSIVYLHLLVAYQVSSISVVAEKKIVTCHSDSHSRTMVVSQYYFGFD